MFNLLPSEIRNLTSKKVNIFKSGLDTFLKNITHQPTISEEGRAASSFKYRTMKDEQLYCLVVYDL